MKRISNWVSALAILMVFVLAACGKSKKEEAGTLTEKKMTLEQLKKKQSNYDKQIAELEAQIAKLDSTKPAEKRKLVGISLIDTRDFSHYIELQGRVDADNISYVTPRGGPGQITAIFVSKGQYVHKGQPILKLDNRILLQQKELLNTQLAFAKDLYTRRNDLWRQGIGSEVELLSAKNNVTQIERQIATLEEQMKMSTVTAEVNGVVDEVMVKVGEIFQGGPQIRIVNTSSLKVVADVPETYAAKVRRGSSLAVSVPDINRAFNTSVSFVGASINPNSRGFLIEGRLPSDGMLKPNQIALVKILDYAASNAVVVPVETIQTDEAGKYVFLAVQSSNGMVAKKVPVAVGLVQGALIEVKVGLKVGDQLVTEGFQSLYEGQVLTTAL